MQLFYSKIFRQQWLLKLRGSISFRVFPKGAYFIPRSGYPAFGTLYTPAFEIFVPLPAGFISILVSHLVKKSKILRKIPNEYSGVYNVTKAVYPDLGIK